MNKTLQFEPSFRVDGYDVPTDVLAYGVLEGYFKSHNFKTIASQTLMQSEVDTTQFETMLVSFDEYLSSDIMQDAVAHDLMGEFFQTYASVKIGRTKVIHTEDKDIVQVRFDITLNESLSQELRDERNPKFRGDDDEYDDDESEFSD